MIKAVIFDLGNVLLNFDHRIIFNRLTAHVSSKVLHEKMDEIRVQVTNFEHGSLSPDNFNEKLGDMLHFEASYSSGEFAKEWSEIFWKNDELIALLPRLKEKVTLHMLSNTNELHIEYAKQEFPEVFAPFSSLTLSYKVGASKPDKEIFLESLKLTAVKAEECLYFDDILEYVKRAQELGFRAHQYVSVQGVRDICALYDI